MKILIVAPAWLGDMVMAQPLLQVLKRRQPGVELAILAPRSTLAITELMPEISTRYVIEEGHGQFSIRKRWQLACEIRQQHFDIAYVLPNSWKSALIPWLARIPQRVGWKGECRYGLLNNLRHPVQQFPLMVERYTALAYPTGEFQAGDIFPYPRLMVPAQLKQDVLEKFSIVRDRKILIISPGAAFGPAKRWPAQYFAEVATAKIEAGWQVWMIGAKADLDIAHTIFELEPRIHHFVAKTSLLEMTALLALSDQVLTNDSGPMHIAASLDKPLVAIFGSSSTGFTPPLSKKSTVLERDNLACRPCFQRVCPFGHYACLTEIKPAQVLKALER